MKVGNNPMEGLLGCVEGIRNCLIEIDRFQTKKLSGLLTMCAWCKKVRDDRGYWKRVEAYICERSYGRVTHGICPDCAGKLTEE
jgi:hypothetical protein